MTTKQEQLLKYVEKNTPSLERIERIRAISIYLDAEDLEGHRDLAFVVDYFTHIRQTADKPTEPKWGGMDRVGIEATLETNRRLRTDDGHRDRPPPETHEMPVRPEGGGGAGMEPERNGFGCDSRDPDKCKCMDASRAAQEEMKK